MNSDSSAVHPTAAQSVRDLRARFPHTPFLTLGQTVLWDEPTKAAFCRILETVAPDATMLAAIHDTDYFAKLPAGQAHIAEDAPPFVMLEHNDGDTRGLWSAAGEISAFLGSETVPGRAVLTSLGVAFDRVARRYPGGESALLNTETAAWGWRAIVHTGTQPLIAADVKLGEVLPALREQLNWAFAQSYQIAPQGKDALDVGAKIVGWVDEYAHENPSATLSDLYRWLTPKLWCLVRGGGGCNLETSTSMELFRFNNQTCELPRFQFLDLFLNAQTRDIARQCYDESLAGSGIYTLDAFGAGATPFDVVIPGRGRGTLRLDGASLFIETETPITLCLDCNCQSVVDLAALLEAQFGPNVAIVGKAVALISMLSAEFIFVFHEKASSYTSRTQAMNNALRARGVTLDLHPMLRLQYETWDALQEVEAELQLPPHLARAYGSATVSCRTFGECWQCACARENTVLEQLTPLHSPRDLMKFLAGEDSSWQAHLEEYNSARERVLSAQTQVQTLKSEIEALREQDKIAKSQVRATERLKGQDWRARVQPLRERIFDLKEAAAARYNPLDENGTPRRLSKDERQRLQVLAASENEEVAALRAQIAALTDERVQFDETIKAALSQARDARKAADEKTQQVVALQRAPEVQTAREALAQLQYEVELARLRRTRDAYTVTHGLPYTNLRPTAWWFPLVSPDANWFRQLARTTQARIEDL